MHHIEHYDEPLYVVDLDQVVEPWKERIKELEDEIANFKPEPEEKQPTPPPEPEPVVEEKINYVQDNAQVDELQAKLDKAAQEI